MEETGNTPTALITGASRGLGLALAEELARRGWTLIIDGRSEPALMAVKNRLALQTRVFAVLGDISDPAHREALANAAAQTRGVDVVVNNAGILGPSPLPKLLDYPLDQLEQVFRINTIAQLGVLQALLPWTNSDARIINITSDAAVNAYPGWGGYGAAKAALEQISAILAVEMPDRRVYTVDPGDMRTQMHQEAYPKEDISDRPLPEESVPGLLVLIEGKLPSGRYIASELAAEKPA